MSSTASEQLAAPYRLYGREYAVCSLYGRGACLLRVGRHDEAADSFRQVLCSTRVTHSRISGCPSPFVRWDRMTSPMPLGASAHECSTRWRRRGRSKRPLFASQVLAVEGKHEDAGATLCNALDKAPPGFAAWTLPIEPFLLPTHWNTRRLQPLSTRLSERAR